MTKSKKVYKLLSLSLTILCVIFIYCNSLMAANISTIQSNLVLNLIRKAAEVIGLSPALITEHMVRKLAHFCEYALLGLLTVVTTQLWYGKLKSHIFMILFWGLLIPVSDEFLQLFVAGRVGSVRDVLLDFAGFIAGILFHIGLLVLLNFLKITFSHHDGVYV